MRKKNKNLSNKRKKKAKQEKKMSSAHHFYNFLISQGYEHNEISGKKFEIIINDVTKEKNNMINTRICLEDKVLVPSGLEFLKSNSTPTTPENPTPKKIENKKKREIQEPEMVENKKKKTETPYYAGTEETINSFTKFWKAEPRQKMDMAFMAMINDIQEMDLEEYKIQKAFSNLSKRQKSEFSNKVYEMCSNGFSKHWKENSALNITKKRLFFFYFFVNHLKIIKESSVMGKSNLSNEELIQLIAEVGFNSSFSSYVHYRNRSLNKKAKAKKEEEEEEEEVDTSDMPVKMKEEILSAFNENQKIFEKLYQDGILSFDEFQTFIEQDISFEELSKNEDEDILKLKNKKFAQFLLKYKKNRKTDNS